MLPSAAEMPPCAATVCDRVGKTLVMHAVDRPFCARPKVARRPAPPAPTTTMSYLCSMILYAVMFGSGSQRDADDREDAGDRRQRTKEDVGEVGDAREQGRVHVVFDHHLQAEFR